MALSRDKKMTEAKNKNIIANSKRTPKERQEIARKGGIASGAARRQKKTMRELLDIALSEVIKNPKTGESKTGDEWMAAAMMHKAMKGDVAAYRTIAEMRGENAPQKIDITSGGMPTQPITVEVIDRRDQVNRNENTDDESI